MPAEPGYDDMAPVVNGHADGNRQRRALVGAGAGLLFGVAVLSAANVDWVFLYLLSAPLRLADAAHDLAGVPTFVLYPLTCAYFAGLGWIFGLLWVFRPSRISVFGIVVVVLAGHLALAIAGNQHLFRGFFDAIKARRSLAPDVGPKQQSSPSPSQR